MEARIGIGIGIGVTGTKSVRIEEAIYCQVEGRSKAGCPLAKQVSKTSIHICQISLPGLKSDLTAIVS
jgi:hypothetical protein